MCGASPHAQNRSESFQSFAVTLITKVADMEHFGDFCDTLDPISSAFRDSYPFFRGNVIANTYSCLFADWFAGSLAPCLKANE